MGKLCIPLLPFLLFHWPLVSLFGTTHTTCEFLHVLIGHVFVRIVVGVFHVFLLILFSLIACLFRVSCFVCHFPCSFISSIFDCLSTISLYLLTSSFLFVCASTWITFISFCHFTYVLPCISGPQILSVSYSLSF